MGLKPEPHSTQILTSAGLSPIKTSISALGALEQIQRRSRAEPFELRRGERVR
jgi:hypothetical protein